MAISDYLIMSAIIGFCFYILYRSLWKKKGSCHGCSCSGGGCSSNSPDSRKVRPAP